MEKLVIANLSMGLDDPAPARDVNFFKPLPMPGNRFYPASYSPNPSFAERSKISVRFVLLTGESDPNRLETATAYESGFQPNGFKHVLYLSCHKRGCLACAYAPFESLHFAARLAYGKERKDVHLLELGLRG